MSGFFQNGACYHFDFDKEGKVVGEGEDAVKINDCPGECTNWDECVHYYTEREC